MGMRPNVTCAQNPPTAAPAQEVRGGEVMPRLRHPADPSTGSLAGPHVPPIGRDTPSTSTHPSGAHTAPLPHRWASLITYRWGPAWPGLAEEGSPRVQLLLRGSPQHPLSQHRAQALGGTEDVLPPPQGQKEGEWLSPRCHIQGMGLNGPSSLSKLLPVCPCSLCGGREQR